MDCPHPLAWWNFFAGQLVQCKDVAHLRLQRRASAVAIARAVPPANATIPALPGHDHECELSHAQQALDCKLRRDISFKQFGDKFDPGRVVCMHSPSRRGNSGDVQVVDIVFFHLEGMARMVGVGLPFGVVQVQADLDSGTRVTVVEWSEEEWREVWLDPETHPKARKFTPLLLAFAARDREEQDATICLASRRRCGSWPDFVTCLIEQGTLQPVRNAGGGPEGQQQQHNSNPGSGERQQGLAPDEAASTITSDGPDTMMSAGRKPAASQGAYRPVTVDVIFLNVNGEDCIQGYKPPALATPPAPPPRRRGLARQAWKTLKSSLSFKRAGAAAAASGAQPDASSSDPALDRMEHVCSSSLKPTLKITFCHENDPQKMKVRVGGEFMLHRFDRANPDEMMGSGCAHDNLRVAFHAPGPSAQRRRLPRPASEVVEEMQGKHITGRETGEDTINKVSRTGKLALGAQGVGAGVSVGAAREHRKGHKDMRGTETPGTTHLRLKGSEFYVSPSSCCCRQNGLALVACHKPAIAKLSRAEFHKLNPVLDNREFIIVGEYDFIMQGNHMYSYTLELTREMYIRGLEDPPKLKEGTSRRWRPPDDQDFSQRYTKELKISHRVPASALRQSFTWCPLTCLDDKHKAHPYIREAALGEERKWYLTSRHIAPQDVKGLDHTVLNKILEENGDRRNSDERDGSVSPSAADREEMEKEFLRLRRNLRSEVETNFWESRNQWKPLPIE